MKSAPKITGRHVLIAMGIAFGGWLLIGFSVIKFITYEPQTEFSQKEWKLDKQDRHKMADHLILTKLLIGKDSLDVKQILGEPHFKSQPHVNWNYEMGMSGMMTFHTLSVSFIGEKVVDVRRFTWK